jgi:hypothetical protein
VRTIRGTHTRHGGNILEPQNSKPSRRAASQNTPEGRLGEDLNVRALALRARKNLPEIRRELELLEKFVKAYEKTG